MSELASTRPRLVKGEVSWQWVQSQVMVRIEDVLPPLEEIGLLVRQTMRSFFNVSRGEVVMAWFFMALKDIELRVEELGFCLSTSQK